MKSISTLFVVFILCITAAFGQGDVAQINGVVTDPQGSVVPGAVVEVKNVDTSAVYSTTTNEKGEWSLAGMGAATYRVTISAAGFSKLQMNDAAMHAGVPLTVNAKLEVGAVSETVSVTGGVDLLQTTNATLATTVQTKQVTDLPYISRGGMDLFITQPGVQTATSNRTSTINGLAAGRAGM